MSRVVDVRFCDGAGRSRAGVAHDARFVRCSIGQSVILDAVYIPFGASVVCCLLVSLVVTVLAHEERRASTFRQARYSSIRRNDGWMMDG